MSGISHDVTKRREYVLLLDVKNGVPNGDPDTGAAPRMDSETGKGLISDVCQKRKIRDFVQIAKGNAPGNEIYIREGNVLNREHGKAYAALGFRDNEDGNEEKGKEKGNEEKKALPKTAVADAKEWMCQNYWDIRTFGAVMDTGKEKCGTVRGPMQVTFAESIDPIMPTEHKLTRLVVTKEEDEEKQRTFGQKFAIPYALYRSHIFFSPHHAAISGFSEADHELFVQALRNMFEHDHSASRGEVHTQALFIFEHDTALGASPFAQTL